MRQTRNHVNNGELLKREHGAPAKLESSTMYEYIVSADPYEGAIAAYRALNPKATGQDWEDWTQDTYFNPKAQFDNFGAFAALCRDATTSAALSEGDRKLVAYAVGFFEAMNLVISGMRDAMPTSAHVFSHFERYRSNLKRFPDRYVENDRDDGAPF